MQFGGNGLINIKKKTIINSPRDFFVQPTSMKAINLYLNCDELRNFFGKK